MSQIIDNIRLKNFKAFQEEQEFVINGKNVLIYGNNGSGKSSLFWALYTFVQSSVKEDEEVEKYFKDFDESDPDTHQSLRNIFMDSSEDAYIEIVTNNEDDNEETYRISQNTIDTNLDEDTTIQELNLASDFINHKLLHNFYNATHRQEINLWPVFERDIFPFLTTESGEPWIEFLKTKTEDVPRQKNGAVIAKNNPRKDAFEGELVDLNDKIEGFLSEIERVANRFLKTQFFDGEEQVKIDLSFDEKFTFDKVRQKIWKGYNRAKRQDFLKISLHIKVKDGESEEWQSIYRPQSFLHESMLTRIAIAVRIGALRTRVQTTSFKILVLDDMLISLDMSNRMDVIEMVLNEKNKQELEFFDEFQKIILTHDKGFYELIKRRTSPLEWKYYSFFSNDKNHIPPKITESRNHIQKAQDYLAKGELELCGHELRKETENLLDKYLRSLNAASDSGEFVPLMDKLNRAQKIVSSEQKRQFKKVFVNKDLPLSTIKKIKEDYWNDPDLDEQIKYRLKGLENELYDFLIKQYQIKKDKTKIIEEVKNTVKRIMNPASHKNFVPLYEKELKKAIDGVKQLKVILNKDELDEFLSVVEESS